MRNPAPLSPTSDESSLFSSFDALALSSSSRHSSAAVASTRGRSSLNPTDESYEVISRRNPSQRSSLSLVSASSASDSRQSTSDDGRRTPSERSGPSKSAARRARQRALEANRSSEVVVAKRPTATLSASGDKVPQNFKPQASPSGALIDKQAIAPNKTGNKAPQQQFKLSTYLSVPSSSDESEPVGTYRKTRRGGKKNRSRLDKAAVRDQLTIGEEAGSSAPPVISSGGDDEYSEDGASRFLDEELDEDEEDEVEGMSALGGGEESVMGTPRSSAGRRKIEGSVMSSEDAKTSIDR
jgi:hypothetical protein